MGPDNVFVVINVFTTLPREAMRPLTHLEVRLDPLGPIVFRGRFVRPSVKYVDDFKKSVRTQLLPRQNFWFRENYLKKVSSGNYTALYILLFLLAKKVGEKLAKYQLEFRTVSVLSFI